MPSRRNTSRRWRVVDRRELEALLADVLPDVELGPVRDREHPDVLARAVAPVVERPQLGPLVLRVPLAELVAERVHPLLGPGLLLVAPGTAEHGVELVLVDGVEQRPRLEAVARRVGTRLLGGPARVDRLLHRGHQQAWPPARRRCRSRNSRTSGKLWPVSMCITGNGIRPGTERLLGQAEHDDRVLATGEQQHRALEFGGHLADDVDRLCLDGPQVRQLVLPRDGAPLRSISMADQLT